MKEHIKKFPTVASADGHVIDAPFVASVVPTTEGAAPLNIRCTQEGKMLSVSGGSIEIVDAGPAVLTLTIEGNISKTIQYEEGMTWTEWVESEYNTDGCVLYDGCVVDSSRSNGVLDLDAEYGGYVGVSDIIMNNHTYQWNYLKDPVVYLGPVTK